MSLDSSATTASKMKLNIVKHLVIPGGAIYGFSFYGALKYLHQQNVWQRQNIETIHCTSVGGLLGVAIAMEYDWDTLDQILLHRSWRELFPLNMCNVVNCFRTNGMFAQDTLKKALLPLFHGKDIPIDITLQDFYERTKVDVHFFTINVCKFELLDVSYRTHPEWPLIDAIYASACAPILFKPLEKNGELYTDGGLFANYPIRQLLETTTNAIDASSSSPPPPPIDPNAVLGIRLAPKGTERTTYNHTQVKKSLMAYIGFLLRKAIERFTGTYDYQIGLEVDLDSNFVYSFDIFSVLRSPEKISEMVEYGIKCAQDALHTPPPPDEYPCGL